MIPDTDFYLTAALGDKKEIPPVFTGPNLKIGDITGRSDKNAEFQLDNLPPGAYYLIVWAPYSWIPAVNPSTDPARDFLIEVKAGQKYPLGVVQFAWP
jgi:hypothetical protein